MSIPVRPEEAISRVLSLIGQPARVRILMAVAGHEACVCHLEAVLGMRQAAISQHLMLLREAGLVTTRRDGRNIFYHLARPETVAILHQAAVLAGIDPAGLESLSRRPMAGCPCPQCASGAKVGPGIEKRDQPDRLNSSDGF